MADIYTLVMSINITRFGGGDFDNAVYDAIDKKGTERGHFFDGVFLKWVDDGKEEQE